METRCCSCVVGSDSHHAVQSIHPVRPTTFSPLNMTLGCFLDFDQGISNPRPLPPPLRLRVIWSSLQDICLHEESAMTQKMRVLQKLYFTPCHRCVAQIARHTIIHVPVGDMTEPYTQGDAFPPEPYSVGRECMSSLSQQPVPQWPLVAQLWYLFPRRSYKKEAERAPKKTP